MRLQAPHLSSSSPSSSCGSPLLSPQHALTSTLLLPDSFGVIHVGETFSAYLGVLNTSGELPVRGLTVGVQLQTPSRRIVLPASFGGHEEPPSRQPVQSSPSPPQDISPRRGVDAIVSRRLEEAGQHILRVEVGYVSNGAKTLRKFYRFNVTLPLKVSESVARSGDDACLVSVEVENVMERAGGGGAVAVEDVTFRPADGLVARRIGGEEVPDNPDDAQNYDDIHADDDDTATNHPRAPTADKLPRRSALALYDASGRLEPGDSHRYLFSVRARSAAASLRGIACGDELGQAVVAYRKAMGESGTVHSSTVVCPPTSFRPRSAAAAGGDGDDVAPSKFVVHKSGLSVDVAAAAARRSSVSHDADANANANATLDGILPVTVEPVDPPSVLQLARPRNLTVLVVNHSDRAMNLQLQMRLSHMTGVVVCGSSFVTLGEVPPRGGSCTAEVRLVALVAGLFEVKGFYAVDLSTGMEVEQPSLFDVFVELPEGKESGGDGGVDGAEEKKTEEVVEF
ncbi:hypothetical protein ACHAXS_012987 [Conticribra weissflogii]